MSRSTLRSWRELDQDALQVESCVCDGVAIKDRAAYAGLLGYYLGDGCISPVRNAHSLRISCDATYPGIIADVVDLLLRVHPARRTYRVPAPGVIVVQSYWKHWPCLFPQHGPGRKHEHHLGMTGWQQQIIDEHPAEFLRGLFHSDGARVRNWATRSVAGEHKRYEYPRWQFVNASEEILGWCGATLDLAGVAWRRSGTRTISVSRREDVARLDALIGPKS